MTFNQRRETALIELDGFLDRRLKAIFRLQDKGSDRSEIKSALQF